MSASVPLRYYFRHPAVRASLWACAVLALVAAILAMLWWPGERDRRDFEARIEARRAEIVRMRAEGELFAAFEKARGDVEALEKKLAYAATQAQQVDDIARLARTHGVSLLAQAYEESTARNEPPMLFTELTVQGGYRSLGNFIADLPQLPSWTEAQDVLIERARAGRLVKGRIRLVTYRGPERGSEDK